MKQIKRVSELERAYINEVLDGGFQSAHNYEMVTRLIETVASANPEELPPVKDKTTEE